MRRGCLIAIVCVLALLVLAILGLWALWVATGRGAPIYQTIGWMCEDTQSYAGAAHWYGKAVRAKPQDAQLRFRHAGALWMLRDAQASLGEYGEAARLAPTWADPLFQKAAVEIYLGEFDAAAQTLDAAEKLVPREAYVQYYRGRLNAAQGKEAEAIQAFRRAIDLNANAVEAYADLGRLLEKRPPTDEALRVYEEGARRGSTECTQRLVALGRTAPTPTAPAPLSPAPQQPQPAAPSTAPAAGTPSAAPQAGGAPPPAFGAMMAGFMALYMLFWGFMMLVITAGWVAQILAIYDCARRDFGDPSTRAMWCLLLVLAQWIGALVYYIVIYRKGEPPVQRPRRPLTATAS